MTQTDSPRGTSGSQVFGGMLLMLLGFLLLTGRLGWSGLRFSTMDWPWVVLAFAVFRLIYPGECRGRVRSRRVGVWLLFLGGWGLVNESGILGIGYADSWPLLLVGFGFNIVWRALEEGGRRGAAQGGIHAH
jgi:hypothetical protein